MVKLTQILTIIYFAGFTGTVGNRVAVYICDHMDQSKKNQLEMDFHKATELVSYSLAQGLVSGMIWPLATASYISSRLNNKAEND